MVATMAVGAFVGCGNSKDGGDSAKSDSGKVYYLNFKPEADEAWQALAKEYTKETGVDVTVVTAASNKYVFRTKNTTGIIIITHFLMRI